MYRCSMRTARPDYRSLPLSERIELVEGIWDSIAEETGGSIDLTDEQRAELHRRLTGHHAEPAISIPWEQVRGKLLRAAR